MIRVPYALNFYDQAEIDAVLGVLNSGSTMAGKEVGKLEDNVARSFGHDFGIMCNSGSSALTLGLGALNLSKGAEVITPALTFATTVASQLQSGLHPVLVDSELRTLNIDVELIEAAITDNTEAMVIPDLMGNFSDWDKIRQIANKHNLALLHDSADTIGHTLRGTPVGTRADISTTSLYGAHIINGAGNGGMVSTSNEAYARTMRKLRSWGRESALFGETEDSSLRFNCEIDGIEYDNKFVFSSLGYNLEGSEISAAFGNVQFSKLELFKKRRRKVFDLHLDFIKKYPDIFIEPQELPDAEVVWYAFPIILQENQRFTRTEMQKYLEMHNIQTRPVFAGNIARQPGFKSDKIKIVGGLENADYIMTNALVIGCHQGMDETHTNWVHEILEKFISLN
jgi:CDP-6-deoxy-D-xylo-4-hexulose-3-dehydrase